MLQYSHWYYILGYLLVTSSHNWPVMIALDVLHCYDDGVQRFHEIPIFSLPTTDVRRRVSTLEIGLGVRRSFTVKGPPDSHIHGARMGSEFVASHVWRVVEHAELACCVYAV